MCVVVEKNSTVKISHTNSKEANNTNFQQKYHKMQLNHAMAQ